MKSIAIQDKRVLITGAGKGLGRELAKAFIARGAFVLANDLDEKSLKELEAEIAHKRLAIVVGDITDRATLQALDSKISQEWKGELDILVNNAGIVCGGEFLKVEIDAHLKTLDINLKALIHTTHYFLPKLLRSSEACLLQVGSVTGMMGLAFGTTYAASKWGVLGFSESLRQELRHLGHDRLHICVVAPSYIATGMFEGSKAPLFMPFLDPKILASKIIRAVERRIFFVREPFLVKTVPLLRALLPLRLQDKTLDFLGVAKGMRHWRGRSDDHTSH